MKRENTFIYLAHPATVVVVVLWHGRHSPVPPIGKDGDTGPKRCVCLLRSAGVTKVSETRTILPSTFLLGGSDSMKKKTPWGQVGASDSWWEGLICIRFVEGMVMAFLQETHTISLQYDLHLTWNSQVFFKTRFGVDSKVTALLKAACMIMCKDL